jgi:hypothetical protein
MHSRFVYFNIRSSHFLLHHDIKPQDPSPLLVPKEQGCCRQLLKDLRRACITRVIYPTAGLPLHLSNCRPNTASSQGFLAHFVPERAFCNFAEFTDSRRPWQSVAHQYAGRCDGSTGQCTGGPWVIPVPASSILLYVGDDPAIRRCCKFHPPSAFVCRAEDMESEEGGML